MADCGARGRNCIGHLISRSSIRTLINRNLRRIGLVDINRRGVRKGILEFDNTRRGGSRRRDSLEHHRDIGLVDDAHRIGTTLHADLASTGRR